MPLNYVKLSGYVRSGNTLAQISNTLVQICSLTMYVYLQMFGLQPAHMKFVLLFHKENEFILVASLVGFQNFHFVEGSILILKSIPHFTFLASNFYFYFFFKKKDEFTLMAGRNENYVNLVSLIR